MKLYRMTSILAAAMLALTALAQQATMTFNDATRHQTVTVTAVGEDIVRVDVVPDGWNGTRLPSLALDKTVKAEINVEELEDMSVMRTGSGMKVVLDRSMGSITVGSRNGYYITDLCDRGSSTLTLLHHGHESFYGAGERGYSFNLAGDTLINYNSQNYGYQMGEKRTKLMGITMPMVISSKGYGVLFDDFCKSSLYLGEQGIEYSSTTPQPISYYVINGNGKVENVVRNFTWLVGRQELPPLWTLGYITSKYGYRDQRESEGVVDTLKREGYPLDGIVFDLYWYGKEEDMGRLEWDKQQ